jgi:hypothetical protein
VSAVIIGIHGLRNKPPKYLLTGWWKKAIIEGFRVLKLPAPRFKFELAYWAHYMHPRSLNPAIKDGENPLYLYEPYLPGSVFGPRDPKTFRKHISAGIHQQVLQLVAGQSGFMNIETVSNIILHRMFVELDTYYHHELRDASRRMRPARDLIREELARLIRKYRSRNILILAHSMGTIIAYDVLLHVVPDIPIHTLITFGAPLGFPVVIKKIKQELNLGADGAAQPLPTPPCLQRRWLNFSDLDDVTCLNYNLRNHYAENANGVRPFDQIVYNNYEWAGYHNPHKSYGYLRTADITTALNNFLSLENVSVLGRMKWLFKGPKV